MAERVQLIKDEMTQGHMVVTLWYNIQPKVRIFCKWWQQVLQN